MAARGPPEGLRPQSFLGEIANPDFIGGIQGVRTSRINTSYSAAAAKEGFAFADDTMKSEMRGTISDLKREPLNTP
jgi:hypothetical protein